MVNTLEIHAYHIVCEVKLLALNVSVFLLFSKFIINAGIQKIR